MWRTPPLTNTSKMHLHVEQFSLNTYWMLTEELMQPKVQERLSCNQVGQKKKKKKKNQRNRTVCPWEGAVKEENFSHPGNPLHWLRDQPGQKGNFTGSKESASAELQQAEQRETSR